MKDTLRFPERKSIRIKDYDYSSCGAYYITICLSDRKNLLWEMNGLNTNNSVDGDAVAYDKKTDCVNQNGVKIPCENEHPIVLSNRINPNGEKSRCENDYTNNLTDCVTSNGEKLHCKNDYPTVGANCVRPKTPIYQLSVIGKTIDNEIRKIESIYSNIEINRYCIMPNHLHIIVFIHAEQDGRTQFAPTISRLVKQFKGSVSKQLGFSIWQKSFYDHIIRNERAYNEICTYIEENPYKWIDDEYYFRY